LIDPATGTALTVSGASCRISGDLKITPDPGNAIGLLVSGAECQIEGVKVLSGTNNICVTGSGAILRRCASGFASAGNACYDIQGIQGRYINCNSVGNTTSYGFRVTTGVDTGVLENCTSAGNQTSGFYIDTASENWTLLNCSTGHDDGRWVDVDHANVFAHLKYDFVKHYTTTFVNPTTTFNIFKVTGAVRISNIYGIIETVIPGTASTIYLQLWSDSGVDITDSPGVNINAAVAGAILVRNSVAGDPLVLANPAGVPAVAENASFKDPQNPIDVVADNGLTTYVRCVLSATLASGAIDWHCEWQPLSDNGFLEDAL
jgi:hypothetical protein